MTSANERTIASVTHLSTLTQYFIPFGNFIFPIIIWSYKKNDSEFVDTNGKQTLNFQLSIFMYSTILVIIAIPLLIFGFMDSISTHPNFNGNFDFDNIRFENFSYEKITTIMIVALVAFVIFGFLKIVEFILIILAAVKASNGENYKYPLTIPFFK